jgi:uncharacterized protein YciI
MSKFSITYLKREKEQASNELESDHQEFLKEMKRRQKVISSTPLNGEYLIIIEEETKEKALNIVYRDPYIQTRYYQTFKLTQNP